MSKFHQPHGRAAADPAKGELRKPDDYSDQPGQDEGVPADRNAPRAAATEPPAPATAPREYGHSSGDRNTKHGEEDWPGYAGGTQRNAPAAPRDPGKRSGPKH